MSAAEGTETLQLLSPVDAKASFGAWSKDLATWLTSCRILEVGSTGIPGLPTKGDLDVAVVAADAEDWVRLVEQLEQRLEPYEPQHWSATWASFRGSSEAGEAGVQVVVEGSDEDAFLRGFRALLLHDPAVVARYAELKVRHDGRPMHEYREAKGRFVERELRARPGC